MNKTLDKLCLSCVKLDAFDVRFGIDFFGVYFTEAAFAESCGLSIGLEIRPSATPDKFDLYVKGSDLFKVHRMKQDGFFSRENSKKGLSYIIAGYILSMKEESPADFNAALKQVKNFETVDFIVGAGIITSKEVLAKTRFTRRDFDRNSIFEMHAAKAERPHLSLVM